MKYFLLVLFFIFAINLSYAEDMPEYCGGYSGERQKKCQQKRMEYFFGDDAVYVKMQVDQISGTLREAILSREYDSLEQYVQFPFTFVVTDFRKAELRKDAIGYTLEVNNMREFKNFLLKINKRHPSVFYGLKKMPYTELLSNDTYIALISSQIKFTIEINDDGKFHLVHSFIQIF